VEVDGPLASFADYSDAVDELLPLGARKRGSKPLNLISGFSQMMGKAVCIDLSAAGAGVRPVSPIEY
jgi:hypothetical protein